jgi:hypothetical protein
MFHIEAYIFLQSGVIHDEMTLEFLVNEVSGDYTGSFLFTSIY